VEKKTWKEKGFKRVAVIGIEDKRQVTIAVSSYLFKSFSQEQQVGVYLL
jgi:hypothetical protein